MNALFTAVFSAIALSATAVSATDVAPNSVVQLKFAQTDFCISASRTADPIGSGLVLAPCGSPLTPFLLTGGAPHPVTQIALNTTLTPENGPAACINAHGVNADGQVLLDVCQDDDLERFHVTGELNNAGKIISIGAPDNVDGQFCLTVADPATFGSPVLFSTCQEALRFEWIASYV